MPLSIGQTPVRESDKQRFAFRTDADIHGHRKGSAWDSWSDRKSLLRERGFRKMLWTIAVILLVLWAVGLVSAYTMGGFIHILLVIAIVMVLVNVIQGRRVL
jgi:hypothetical protein